MTSVFVVVLFLTFFLSLLINRLFLKDYYIKNKLNTLVGACSNINTISGVYGSGSEELKGECDRLVNNYGMSIIVADSSFTPIYSSENRSDMLISRLVWHFFSPEDMPDRPPGPGRRKTKLLLKTENLTVEQSDDAVFSSEYIELWGNLQNGDLIFMRSPVESIRESVDLSNRFFLYITLLMAAVGAFIIWILSRRITSPLLRLCDVTDRMAQLDFDARYEERAANEVDDLGERINDMSDRLKEAMSDLKTANNELMRDIEKREKMESMRSEFISNVSHELKTPIALIQGYAEGLKDNVNTDPESRDFYCDVIIDESDRMNRLVKNLLTLNQLEFGDEEIKLERFDITAMIKSCILSADILLKQFGVSARLDNEESICVWGDEFRVEEVFSNFFSNAVHYAGGEKHIEVSIERKEAEKKVRVNVFNTGNPIPEEALDHIWDKFYKVDKARSREVGGSGVGLSIVKAIMEALNNSYGVVNYENGVAFYFELDEG